MKKILSLIEHLHNDYVFKRRVNVLLEILSALIPNGSSVLDIGCGNGHIDSLIMQNKPGVTIQGLEVLERPKCLIDCKVFDGIQIPLKDLSVDICMFIDVLHHTHNIKKLLEEAYRVSRRYILIKDHICKNLIDHIILKFMDWIGNRPHGVNLVYNYKSKQQWDNYFSDLELLKISWNEEVNLYPFPANLLFGQGLHFITLLEKKGDKV